MGLASVAERALWSVNVAPYLADSLWSARDRYDAGHFLMVPLHAAFELDEPDWQSQFREHFSRFVASLPTEEDLAGARLDWLQYLYAASRFLVLASDASRGDLVPTGLPEFVAEQVHRYWSVRPAAQYARAPFPGGIRERLDWKLSVTSVPKSYYRAIIDEESFLFAMAADVRHWENTSQLRSQWSSELDEILDVARAAYAQRAVPQSGGGWLFQPGVWADHPDFAYAGQNGKVPGMPKAPLADVAEDASHSLRYPLWLVSLRGAARDQAEYAYYSALLVGLARQFTSRVLVQPGDSFPAWRLTNFMDGRNGVYRWQYSTAGEGNGYGPFELSGSFNLGWWGFLRSSLVREAYADQALRFPLPAQVLETYVGPSTTRQRHPLVTLPNDYSNGFRELIVRLASHF
jgi:hypothetical protein